MTDLVREYVAAGTAVALGAIAFLLARNSPQKSKYKTDLAAIASRGQYDYVIVGAGTAGCVLAARLSEDPSVSVLAIEAGQSGAALGFSQIPTAYPRIIRYDKHDYGLLTTAQHGHIKKWPRGKLVGGCSSVNAMIFHYGTPEDYNEWARVAGDDAAAEGWSYDQLKKYFLKFENFIPSPSFPVDTFARGNDGPVTTGFFGHCSNMASQFIRACESLGIPIKQDFNTASVTYINPQGQRVSAETAYLTLDVLARPNLTVLTGAPVTRILFEGKRAVGVELRKGQASHQINAKYEVILSAGAVHTPHLLLLSGVGPAEELKQHGIPVVHDLPGVGKHLLDHPSCGVVFKVKKGESLNKFGATKMGVSALMAALRWKYFGTGPMTTNVAEAAAFVRSDDSALFPTSSLSSPLQDSTSGPAAPDLELLGCPVGFREHGVGVVPQGESATLISILLRPTSKGSITLNSSDPFDRPIIDPQYLSTKHDLDVLTRGVKLCCQLARTKPLSSIMLPTPDVGYDHTLADKSDAEIETFVREQVQTMTGLAIDLLPMSVNIRYHPTSTARMAPLSDQGVLDTTLKPHGLTGLRIVDASAFPTIVSGHTTGPVLALAERAADLIKESKPD